MGRHGNQPNRQPPRKHLYPSFRWKILPLPEVEVQTLIRTSRHSQPKRMGNITVAVSKCQYHRQLTFDAIPRLADRRPDRIDERTSSRNCFSKMATPLKPTTASIYHLRRDSSPEHSGSHMQIDKFARAGPYRWEHIFGMLHTKASLHQNW
ncbi:unnamed protein product [Protopolystoma xenopodis]|uniref:Uncharacterized protein n=1 Tax=Protopolystoma xenopodis TaxID=117903 RepID=A0A448WA55_9PLAT|nr:unnamed protein product [Protopolystoma xenopodis]